LEEADIQSFEQIQILKPFCLFFWHSAIASTMRLNLRQSQENLMGPKRITNEPQSAYRLRYARYCMGWVLLFLLPLLALLVAAPNVLSFSGPLPLLLMFLYVGLPLGLAVAALAGFGFLVGGIWSKALERNPRIAFYWPRAKETLKALVLAPLVPFGFFAIARGLIDKEVFLFTRGKGLPMVTLAHDPVGYTASMVVWFAVTVGLAVYLYKELRKAYAA
jgi:hypothetical protein